MGDTAALLQFSAASCLLLTAMGGLASAWLIASFGVDDAGRIRFGVGYLALALSACIEAATIGDAGLGGLPLVGLAFVRLVGAVALAIAAVRWRDQLVIRIVLGATVVLAGAGLLRALDLTMLSDVAVLGASALIWCALVLVGRQTVPVSLIAATSAGVVAAGLGAAGVLTLVLDHSSVMATVRDTAPVRDDMLQGLFVVVALCGALALLIAMRVGTRLGRGLRDLTFAAQSIQAGDLHPGSGPEGLDELGQLGRAFESMASSIRFITGDLRVSAERESRLRGRLEAVIAGMVEGLVVSDRDGRVTECNRAAAELLGVDADEMLGRPVDEVVWFTPADRQGPIPIELPGEGVLVMRGSVDGPDGIDVPCIVTGGVLRDPQGRSNGSVLVIRDQRREQEIEKMKTDFLSNIGHELRSPLTPIKGYAGVLQRRPVEPEQAAAFAREISAGVEQLERVIGRLVNFATAAAGRLEVRPVPEPIGDLVAAMVERWRGRVGEGWSVAADITDGETVVEVDRLYFEQAIDELVDNAVKYSPDGSRITIACGMRQGGGGRRARMRVSVVDQGVGIDPAKLEALTAEFAQGDTSATRRFGGLGLGLALVSRIVRAHRGRLVCESTRGRGSRFSILLPVAIPGEDDGTGLSRRPEESTLPG